MVGGGMGMRRGAAGRVGDGEGAHLGAPLKG